MKPRTITATVEGRTHQISEMWIVGASRHMTIQQAVEHWHIQTVLHELAQAREQMAFRAGYASEPVLA